MQRTACEPSGTSWHTQLHSTAAVRVRADHAALNAAAQPVGRSHQAVKVPCDMFVHTVKVEEALTAAHPDLLDLQACANSAVLCTRNVTVDEFNTVALRSKQQQDKDRDLEEHPIQVMESHTKVKAFNGIDAVDDEMITNEFLNMCDSPGVPPHRFQLFKGCVAMVTRDLDGRFQNGKRVIVTNIGHRSIEVLDANIYDPKLHLEHHYQPGDKAMIPRILFDWPHRQIGLSIQRRQFPLRLAYAETFNKSQGKTLKHAVIDIYNQLFAHGQLYVAFSRV